MPTKLPRLNVTVTPEQHSLLLELAELNGGSASGYLRQMLDTATPLLRAAVPALRMASQEMDAKRDEVQTALASMLAELERSGFLTQGDLLGQLDAAAAHGAARTERGEGGRAKSGDRHHPPYSNTGVRSSGPRSHKRSSGR